LPEAGRKRLKAIQLFCLDEPPRGVGCNKRLQRGVAAYLCGHLGKFPVDDAGLGFGVGDQRVK